MGMRGEYIAIEDSLLSEVINGDKHMFDIDPTQCPSLQIDKTYHAIQYLLCKEIDGGEPPMAYVVPIRDENELHSGNDIDAFYITAQQVKEASDYLISIEDDSLKAVYDFKLMREKKIYPLFGREDDGEANDFYEYIYSHLVMIRDYFIQAAEKGHAIIFWII